MKPLATPVIGGMISSLIHILIVTPVIFAWLRERELCGLFHEHGLVRGNGFSAQARREPRA